MPNQQIIDTVLRLAAEGKSQSVIAKQTGISQPQVSRIINSGQQVSQGNGVIEEYANLAANADICNVDEMLYLLDVAEALYEEGYRGFDFPSLKILVALSPVTQYPQHRDKIRRVFELSKLISE